ncbi:MAG: DUF3431 domain-containing protein [Planctomycetota bacterium]
MSELELVVARHLEDLRWLRRVPSAFRVLVYDKGGGHEGGVPLPNLGFEAHTYLHHVVARYDDLAALTVFAQGYPFDHVPDLHRRLAAYARGEFPAEGFRWLGFVADLDDAHGDRLFRTWSKNRDGRGLDLDGFCRALFDEPAPPEFAFFPGAHFVVRREQVLRRPRAFYERALALSREFPDGGHCFERTWDRVFDAEGMPAALRGRELPVYLRPVRRLGITWDTIDEELRRL